MRGSRWSGGAARAQARQDKALQQSLLAPARGALQPPIRDELLGAAGFGLIGQVLALQHGDPVRGGRATPFFPRLRENIAVLHEAHRAIALQERNGRHVSPAGVWLLDNIHLVVAQTREVHDGLPRRYFRGLPVLRGGAWADLPRVYAIAWAYVAHADSAFEPALLIDFLRAYQIEQALTQGELWALPTTLRVVLVENLRRLAERVAAEEAAREVAHTLYDGLDDATAGALPQAHPDALFAQLQARGVVRSFALQVMQHLHADGDGGSEQGALRRAAIRRALADALPEPAAAQAEQQAVQAADNLSVGNAIRSLQLLGSADWRGLIAQASGLMRALLAWPPFAAERDDTQDTTLHAIERLARRSRRSEQAVAGTLLGLAQTPLAADATGANPPRQALGYWLQGEGAGTMRRALGLRPGIGPRRRARLALPLLLGTLGLGTLALVAAWMHLALARPVAPLGWVLLALLALWPASETVIAALNRLISESVPPHRLPRLALAGGIPVEHRVLVVLPALLSDAATVAALAQRLERHHLANRESHAQFALLTDHADADSEHQAADSALLAAAVAAIDALEARHGNRLAGPDGSQRPAATRRFLLLHRERQWCDSEQRWIGWERKRGKLEQLVALLAGGSPAQPLARPAFVDLGARSQPAPGTPYIVTLDSDTVLPPGALRELVAIAAHPLNQPRIDHDRRRVVGGHGILQPRIVAAWPTDAQGRLQGPQQASVFHRLFAGASGSDPYNAVASEVYQDLFDEGSFTGKGLLHVAALQAVLAGRLPDNQVLSHDLLEGCIARCGSVSDVAVIEPAPSHADVAAARIHRWTRGDWQLLPLLAQAHHYGLGAIARWKLLDNLRRSLVAPAALLLLLVGLAGGPVSPWAALALAAAAFGAGPLVGAVTGLAPSRDDLALRHFARQALAELGRTLLGLLWHIALWLRQALLQLDAVARALWRSRVSRRGLLQWTTAAAAEAAALHGPRALLRAHAGVTLAALILGAALLALGTPAPGLTLVLCALWMGTPVWIAAASRPGSPPPPLPAADADYLRGVAHDTWTWFAQYVNADSNHLPPDNVQTVPRLLIAERTSPTNIGLYLLSLACARAFGWINTEEMAQRLQATLDTLDRLPRERGHFMNWIDTRTLQTLPPAYVSAVDSGNLCGHLLAVATACEEAAAAVAADGALQARLGALALRCRRHAEAADFAFLYDARRRLLHIGWRVAEQHLDAGHYDLLASESRLASLWAIAKGDLPATHWAALGRPFQATLHEVGLRSWSGSMFEYLMPTLVLDEPAGSVLACAGQMAVAEQRDYGRLHHVPWGVSESAYAAADRTLAYQYAPQGVPRLALRRTPPDERVVAPYACALAALLAPRAAVANLRRLEALQARGPLGFIEALDYTASRQAESGHAARDGPPFTAVSTGMAHHQGMTLVALADVLLQGQPRRWTMADARLAAVATLLQERLPREVARLKDPAPNANRGEAANMADRAPRDVRPGAHALQRTQMLANGRYSVTLRANGAGCSRLGDVDISRSRDDALRDAHGSFVYLRRAGPGGVLAPPVSLTLHPAADPAADYTACFHSDRMTLDAVWPDMRTRITVWVSPEDDIELRRVELWNTSGRPITLELLSAFEACLSPARADEMHPAFANLFISADWDAADQALYLSRKPRRDSEAGLHAVHFLAHTDTPLTGVRASADRAQWLGRLRAAWQPQARFDAVATPTGAVATGLDPVAALALRLTLAPHGMAQVTLATAAAPERATLAALVDRYRLALGVERASQLSATMANLRQREQRLAADERVAVQTLTTLLVLQHARPSVPAGTPRFEAADPLAAAASARQTDRRLLWRFGISGDRPLIVVTVAAPQGLRLVRTLVQGLLRWAWGGVACDLVLINAEPRSYLQPLQRELQALRERHSSDAGAEAPACAGGLFLLHDSDVTPAEHGTLALLARVRLHADGRPLTQHVADLVAWHDAAQSARDDEGSVALDQRPQPQPGSPAAASASGPGSAAAAGGFDAVSGAYAFSTSTAQPTPRPWINVLANPGFGAMVSEAGAGCTWAGNSRLFQLTPWSNDPLADNASERFWVQDLRSREAWNLGAGLGGGAGPHRVEHAPGHSSIRHRHGDIEWQCSWSVDAEQAVKRVHLRLRNHGEKGRALRVVGLLDWVLGAVLSDRLSVRTAMVSQPATPPGSAAAAGAPTVEAADTSPTGAERRREPRDDGMSTRSIDTLLATQLDDHDGLAGHTAFATLQRDGTAWAPLRDWTCDRRELFDSRGRSVLPDQFGQHAGGGSDPCAALSLTLLIAAGASDGCAFTIGHGATRQAALDLARSCAAGPTDADAAAQAGARFDSLLGAVTVHTPDPLFDALVNHWLLYQTTACRLWGRAGFYQAGGAYGFRDQLQDAMALAVTAPQLLREQVLRAAGRQFVEGDVQHWWHPHSGAGVRTRFSDDLLWLPHAALHYVDATDDSAVWDEPLPFIEGLPVPEGAEDLYSLPNAPRAASEGGPPRATLYEHCARTLDHSLALGRHGLPLMGGGDWNDGMNRVGSGGQGESVWLAWFLCRIVTDFAPVAAQRGEHERLDRWLAAAQVWRAALQGPAWDGAWYKRAFFDDGSALGSSSNAECRIDLIAQAWSVLSGAAPPGRQRTAMASAGRLLADTPHGLLRLLDPPLQQAQPSAGYIQAYPPGVRENGGQYNHGAVWAVMAWAQLGQADAAWRAWVAISPAHRATRLPAPPLPGMAAEQPYGLEPYAVAADVYSQPPYTGRGGWSWYSGSAGALYRAAVASICGLQVQGGRLRMRPALPSHWPCVQITLRRAGRVHRITVCAATARSDIETARAQGARTLATGDWLTLAQAGNDSHHLVIGQPGDTRPLAQPPEGEPHELGPHRRPMEPTQGQDPRTVGQVDG